MANPRAGQVWHESCTDSYGYTVLVLSKKRISPAGHPVYNVLVTFPNGDIMLDRDAILVGEAKGNTRIA